MFSTSWKCLLLLLVCGCATSRALKNGSSPRTFVVFRDPVTDEPIDVNVIIGLETSKSSPSSRNQTVRATQYRLSLSEDAQLFLTGSVSTILIPSFYTLVCCISVPINILAVLAFARGIRPKKPAAIYMLNLAATDLLFALLLPFKISYHFEGNNWRFGEIMCRGVTAAFYWNMYCSVLLIACISVDRLLAVVYPIDSLSWRRPQNSVKACISMWILSLAGSIPLVISKQTFDLPDLNITTCHDVQGSERMAWLRLYFIILCCALFFLPLLVTVVSYFRVVWSLSSVPGGIPGSSRRRSRAVVMILVVLVIFLLCFMPTNCLLLAHYLLFDRELEKDRDTPDGSYGLYLLFMCLGSLNCVLDPLVYYFGSSQCQRQLSGLLTCEKIKDRRAISHSSSDSCRSSKRAILKSSSTESSKLNSSIVKTDIREEGLNSQYRKLLV
uniref:Proteinase-activated receptor 1 n=1 Tax=Oryzias latipes TaxID=8090 RepID=A0A3P9JTG7_ORYLA